MKSKNAVTRLAVVGLSQTISDLEWWCQPEGEELIVEKLQEQQPRWQRSQAPAKKEVDEERERIRKRLNRLKDIQKESDASPAFTEWISDLFTGDCSWKGDEHDVFMFFNDLLYGANGPYTEDEFKLLCIQEFDKERKFFENLKSKFIEPQDNTTGENSNEKNERRTIPEKVRIYVWRRDGGKCSKCGLRENLEYDHIIPVSLGGGNTARNIELLCERCNRIKGAAIC